jgi:hypothetical protein
MLEKEIEKNILYFLDEIGIFAWKNQSVGIFDPKKKIFRKNHSKFAIKGVSDIIGLLANGRALFIEVKAKKGILSDDQRIFLVKAQDNGAVAFVSRSVEQTFDQLRHYLPNSDKYLNVLKKYQQLEKEN